VTAQLSSSAYSPKILNLSRTLFSHTPTNTAVAVCLSSPWRASQSPHSPRCRKDYQNPRPATRTSRPRKGVRVSVLDSSPLSV